MGGSLFLIGSHSVGLTVGACAIGTALKFKFEPKLCFVQREEERAERGDAPTPCATDANKLVGNKDHITTVLCTVWYTGILTFHLVKLELVVHNGSIY